MLCCGASRVSIRSREVGAGCDQESTYETFLYFIGGPRTGENLVVVYKHGKRGKRMSDFSAFLFWLPTWSETCSWRRSKHTDDVWLMGNSRKDPNWGSRKCGNLVGSRPQGFHWPGNHTYHHIKEALIFSTLASLLMKKQLAHVNGDYKNRMQMREIRCPSAWELGDGWEQRVKLVRYLQLISDWFLKETREYFSEEPNPLFIRIGTLQFWCSSFS